MSILIDLAEQTFTKEQYQKAIEHLQLALNQHKEGTQLSGCDICGDAHGVDECRWNPLRAMAVCKSIAINSDELHGYLHYLAGYDTRMGETVGPAAIVPPDDLTNESDK